MKALGRTYRLHELAALGAALFASSAAYATPTQCIATHDSNDDREKIWISSIKYMPTEQRGKAALAFRRFAEANMRQNIILARCDSPEQIAKLVYSETNKYQNEVAYPAVVVAWTYKEIETADSSKGDNAEPNLRYVSCVYTIYYQRPGFQDKYYISAIFRANTAPHYKWNSVITNWTNYIESNYITTGAGQPIDGISCDQAASEALLASKRRQMITNASAGGRSRVNVAYDGKDE